MMLLLLLMLVGVLMGVLLLLRERNVETARRVHSSRKLLLVVQIQFLHRLLLLLIRPVLKLRLLGRQVKLLLLFSLIGAGRRINRSVQ